MILALDKVDAVKVQHGGVLVYDSLVSHPCPLSIVAYLWLGLAAIEVTNKANKRVVQWGFSGVVYDAVVSL